MPTAPIRRQEHGIKSQDIRLTFPGAQLDRLRREAAAQGISVSRHVASLIDLAWTIRDRLATVTDESEVA